MTTAEIVSMTAEAFNKATVAERMEALDEMMSRINFEKAWLEKHSYMDKRGWEYRMHNERMKDDWETVSAWLNGIGIETNPLPAD